MLLYLWYILALSCVHRSSGEYLVDSSFSGLWTLHTFSLSPISTNRSCRLMCWEGSLCPREFLSIRMNLRTVFSCFKKQKTTILIESMEQDTDITDRSEPLAKKSKKTCIATDVPWLLFQIRIFFIFFEVSCQCFIAVSVCQTGFHYLTLKKKNGFTARYCIYIWYSRQFLTVQTDKKNAHLYSKGK